MCYSIDVSTTLYQNSSDILFHKIIKKKMQELKIIDYYFLTQYLDSKNTDFFKKFENNSYRLVAKCNRTL